MWLESLAHAGQNTHLRFDLYFACFAKPTFVNYSTPRFFAQSEPNQCRKILWRVNINNYQNKLSKVELHNHLSYQHENWCARSWSKVSQASTRTFAFLKKHGRHWPTNLSTC